MKKLLISAVLAAFALGISGCSSKEAHTVTYYEKIPKSDLEKKLDWCKKVDAMNENDRIECQNAQIVYDKNWR